MIDYERYASERVATLRESANSKAVGFKTWCLNCAAFFLVFSVMSFATGAAVLSLAGGQHA